MAVRGCPMATPADPADLAGPLLSRPTNLPFWSWDNLTGMQHSHKYHFSPLGNSPDGWATVVRASQFRPDCSRLLLVEDDMNNSGIGFTAKLWAFALLVAMRDGRILLEVPRVHGVSRWCDRPPFSFQCLYQAWSHCPLPAPGTQEVVPGGRPLKISQWPHKAPIVRTGLGRIHRQGMFWYSSKSSPVTTAQAFLFRPRPWVRAIGDCVMAAAGVEPGKFVSIHIRHSVEKAAEGKKLKVELPALRAYHPLSKALAEDTGLRSFFLQTASPAALADFSQFARNRNLNISYTDNPRSENDAWGGWQHGSEMEQATVGAVNAYIGTRAAVIASPSLSIWTEFLRRTTSPILLPDGSQYLPGLLARCPPSLAKASTFDVFGPRARASDLPALGRACSIRARHAAIKVASET
jgi:hypothetical protein